MKVLCFSVTPSPYQRDFFHALAGREDCELRVRYFEEVPDDSPWEQASLESWEQVLPGRVFGKGRVRCHWNGGLPNVKAYDRVVINAPLTGLTTQRLFRQLKARDAPPWCFWGEQLLARTGFRRAVQARLSAPLGHAAAIAAIGRSAQIDYQERFPNVRIHDIPYACDLAEFEQAARQRELGSTCRFLFAGQMIERKGVDVLLKAMDCLVKEALAVELHLVGREGELPGWLGALDPSTREKVHYHGFQQPAALAGFFERADVLVLPSRHDGWGVVVNQALGAAMPVITSTAAGAGRDLVVDGLNGLHVPPGEISALAAAMRQLATDPAKRASMAEAARVSAQEIQPSAAAARWMELLNALEAPQI